MHGKAKEQAEIDGEKELIETSTVKAIGKDTYGNITVDGLQKELENDATVKKIRKKIVVTINDSQRMYYIDDSGDVFEYEYFDLAIMENGEAFYNRMADYRSSILTVTVIDNMNVPENAYQVFDVSKEQNETVKAWLVENAENSGMYDYLFQYCQKLKTIYVSNKWNNDKVNRVEFMFQGCSSLEGSISFDSTKTTVNYANCDTGYFTYKAIE